MILTFPGSQLRWTWCHSYMSSVLPPLHPHNNKHWRGDISVLFLSHTGASHRHTALQQEEGLLPAWWAKCHCTSKDPGKEIHWNVWSVPPQTTRSVTAACQHHMYSLCAQKGYSSGNKGVLLGKQTESHLKVGGCLCGLCYLNLPCFLVHPLNWYLKTIKKTNLMK